MAPPKASRALSNATMKQSSRKSSNIFLTKSLCNFIITRCLFVPKFDLIGYVKLDLRPENHPESLACKRSHSKIPQKIFHTVLYLKILFYPHQPTFGRDDFFFSPTVSYAHFPNGITLQKKQKQDCIPLCYCNANKIYDVQTMQIKSRDFARKVVVVKLYPKDLKKSRRLLSSYFKMLLMTIRC